MSQKPSNSSADDQKPTADDWVAEVAQEDSEEIRRLRGEITRLNRSLAKYRSGTNLIIDAVHEVFGDFKPEKPLRPKKKAKSNLSEEVAVLHVTDLQFGKITRSYNSTIAAQRLLDLAKKVVKITDMRRSAARINKIHVYQGGDMVEGEQIFAGQAHVIDSSVFDQAVKGAPTALSRLIQYLAQHFVEVKVECVWGNHGRVSGGRKTSNDHHRTNWDHVCYEVQKLMLLGPGRNDDGHIFFPSEFDWYAVDDVLEWGNLLVHGDQIGGGFAGFPWYGVGKKAWGWIDAIEEPWDYLYLGHFHTHAQADLNHRTFLATGSPESDNDFAQQQLAAAGHPSQRLSFYDKEHGMIATSQIYLGDPGERRPFRNKALGWG